MKKTQAIKESCSEDKKTEGRCACKQQEPGLDKDYVLEAREGLVFGECCAKGADRVRSVVQVLEATCEEKKIWR